MPAKAKSMNEMYGPAMSVRTKKDADRVLAELVGEVMLHGKGYDEAQGVVKENLGYFAGYHDHETRLRVEGLFECEHPILGAAKDGCPGTWECFALGYGTSAGVARDELHGLRRKWMAERDDGRREAMVKKFLHGLGFYEKI